MTDLFFLQEFCSLLLTQLIIHSKSPLQMHIHVLSLVVVFVVRMDMFVVRINGHDCGHRVLLLIPGASDNRFGF
jgi:predicted aspartyl protease